MKIRTYLTLSYVAIIVMIAVGMAVVVELTLGTVSHRNLLSAEHAVKKITNRNQEMSEKILTAYGEKVVEAEAEEVAREVAILLGGRDTYNYERLRADESLRKIATRNIVTSSGVGGYVTLGDRQGMSILHPDRKVEGKNFKEWSARYPGLWELVRRSFTEEKVKGYYTFVGRDSERRRKKYMVLVHVPNTPLTVAATVYIDQYFLPVRAEILETSKQTMGEAKQSKK